MSENATLIAGLALVAAVVIGIGAFLTYHGEMGARRNQAFRQSALEQGVICNRVGSATICQPVR